MKWYESISLEPYVGRAESPIPALLEALGMNVVFDDVDCSTCRFCFQEDECSPIVDYDVGFDELREWFDGERSIVLTALEHDPSRFCELEPFG